MANSPTTMIETTNTCDQDDHQDNQEEIIKMATTYPRYLYEWSSCLQRCSPFTSPFWIIMTPAPSLFIWVIKSSTTIFIHLSLSLHSGALSDHLISSTATSTQEYIYEMEKLRNQPQSSSKKIKKKTFCPVHLSASPGPALSPLLPFPVLGNFAKIFRELQNSFYEQNDNSWDIVHPASI